MANIRIPHLPNEILYEIVSYVNDEDILNLRLSAKVFQSITAGRFASTFFEDRAYELSAKGLKALVKITEHPIFAPHIRTVVIGHGGKHSSAKYHNLLEQAFQNLAIIGNPISLGLRRVRTSHNNEPDDLKAARPMVRFLEDKMLVAAVRAQMRLENLVSDTQDSSQNRSLPSSEIHWAYFLYDQAAPGSTIHSRFSGLQVKSSPAGCNLNKSGEILINFQASRLVGSYFSFTGPEVAVPYTFPTVFARFIWRDVSWMTTA
ncbi:unnamed protein product [Aureobasidium mustum]|uniref:F-box domain-containing protein n=1 Tax=Aureobasidium mustum TaxID=2773714 RepID=A0A9N8PKJ5_9PEZI|nr:unnamed protein product [Aureobasidium mustum]